MSPRDVMTYRVRSIGPDGSWFSPGTGDLTREAAVKSVCQRTGRSEIEVGRAIDAIGDLPWAAPIVIAKASAESRRSDAQIARTS